LRYIEEMQEELLFIKEINNIDTWLKQIIPKSDIKENLWRSPDFADGMMMRMVFELDKNRVDDDKLVLMFW
jgi:hypothetical protein